MPVAEGGVRLSIQLLVIVRVTISWKFRESQEVRSDLRENGKPSA